MKKRNCKYWIISYGWCLKSNQINFWFSTTTKPKQLEIGFFRYYFCRDSVKGPFADNHVVIFDKDNEKNIRSSDSGAPSNDKQHFHFCSLDIVLKIVQGEQASSQANCFVCFVFVELLLTFSKFFVCFFFSLFKTIING